MPSLSKVTLELQPAQRFDVIDVNRRAEAQVDDFFRRHRRTLYCSYHTTAGYLEQSLSERLGEHPGQVRGFLESYQRLFPPGADYQHDRLERRAELSDEQRQTEPLNADSHLTFIGGGLESCVTYENVPGRPVHFIDLDGVNANGPDGSEERRKRQTTLIGFDEARPVAQTEIEVPLSGHPIDSINLKDPSLGFYAQIEAFIAEHGIQKGRLDLRLADGEEHAGLTVNEDETLLMTHDLREVLGDPLHFMAIKGWSLGRLLLHDPAALRSVVKRYAKYDFVQVINKLLDKTGLDGSLAERFIDRFLTGPVERRLRMKRSMSLLISDEGTTGALPGGTSNHHQPGEPASSAGTPGTKPAGARPAGEAGERRAAGAAAEAEVRTETSSGAGDGHPGREAAAALAASVQQPAKRAGHIVQGRFQSPILVQWRPPKASSRRIVATLSRFE